MTIIRSVIHNGRLQLDEPVNLPDGSQVEVIVHVTSSLPLPALVGMTEVEQEETPEEIERWIADVESIPPITMSDEEWAAWQQRRKEDREWQLADALEREKRLQRSFE